MNQTLATSRKHAAGQRRVRFDFPNSTAARPRRRHRTQIDMLRPPIIDRFQRDWYALRIWEDDGGGQAQLR